MRKRESGGARDLFVDARIVLHSARSEWVQSCINRHVQLGKSCEMTNYVDFRDFHFISDFVPHRDRKLLFGDVERRQLVAAAPFFGVFEDEAFTEFHLRSREIAALSAETKWSSCSRVCSSVTATRKSLLKPSKKSPRAMPARIFSCSRSARISRARNGVRTTNSL